MTHTSHKSESSIRQYTSKCPPKKQREMSAALAKSLQSDDNDDVQIETVVTVSNPTENNNSTKNLDWLEIDLQDISDDKLVDVLTQIENQNQQLVQATNTNTQITGTKNTINVNSVSNVNKPLFSPGVYFPHSSVTINYNITNYNITHYNITNYTK